MNEPRILSAGALLGMGLGGFLDGIVFHQILQLHSMLSNRVPRDSIVNVEINMFWDGIFHAGCWLLVAMGVGLLFWTLTRRRQLPPTGRAFLGALLIGWGLFNLVEGLIDHQLLALHHVHQGGDLRWDQVFLASGVALCGVGVALRRGSPAGR